MSTSIATWRILFIWMLPYSLAEDGVFECGAHGRFEYCIDGIPGCVIGCHCHPGYYFDTESKICEPNSKLTQNYRRQYMPEPTRVQKLDILSDIEPTEPLPTLTTHNIIDKHVNDITKNADDLGDWLYNQFFKTIENQVINNTNKDMKLTRRSGQGSFNKHKKLKRRARRKGKNHKKNKKGLQGKLLRIAEDDSLFRSSDSDDDDSSDDDDTSDDDDDSSDDSSDEGHNHKKILLLNKKPKPPLPSFLFIPQMNTAYYPPIGLPPPPVMPMYPMVPVPPMMPAPPLMPIIEIHGGTTSADPNTSSVATTQVTITESTKTEASTITTTTTTTTLTDEPSTQDTAVRSRHRGRKRKKIKPHENFADDYDELPPDNYEPSRENRQKLMKLLRQRLNHPKSNGPYKKPRKPFDKYINQVVPPDTLMDNYFIDDAVMKDVNSPSPNLENTAEVQNVDFKYLTELIHRVNDNQTQNDMKIPQTQNYNVQDFPKTITPSKWSDKRYHDFSVPLVSGRRLNQEKIINPSRNHQTDDTYYSNLGRQIATLIRTIDADKERQYNIEIGKVEPKTNDHPYFNENGPRTFWERFVRSPLTLFNSFRNRFDNAKNSNELLFNIENKVETIASTEPTLSLHELENLINVMQTARTQFQSNARNKSMKPLNRTFNVNLWPRDVKQSQKTIKDPTRPDVINIKSKKATTYPNTKVGQLKTKSNKIGVQPYPSTNRFKEQRVNDVYIQRRIQMQPVSKNITNKITEPTNLIMDRKPVHYRHNPTVLNHKNIKKYFFDNNNQYSFQNDDLRLHYVPAGKTKLQVNPLMPSPYFHHETNHIDYIVS